LTRRRGVAEEDAEKTETLKGSAARVEKPQPIQKSIIVPGVLRVFLRDSASPRQVFP